MPPMPRWKPFIRVAVFVLLLFTGWLAAVPAPDAYAQTARVAIVFALGGLGDQSFNDSAYEGILWARDQLGIEFQQAEPSSVAEFETYLTRFAQTRRFDLIIAIGFEQTDAVTTVAARFPQQRFAIIDAVAEGENVASYVYREPERAFLVGAVAGLTTRSNVIGVVGGMDVPLINANIAGYIAGAKYVNPQVDVRYSYVGSFGDPARGKELALAQFDQGVDVIWAAAGLSGLGVIQAAQEKDKYVIGADSDQGYLAPDHVLTNGLKLVNNTVLLAVQSILDGSFTPGVHSLGLAEGVLGYSENLVAPEVKARVDELAQRIIAGELVPPATLDAVESWLAENRS